VAAASLTASLVYAVPGRPLSEAAQLVECTLSPGNASKLEALSNDPRALTCSTIYQPSAVHGVAKKPPTLGSALLVRHRIGTYSSCPF
jgi:hypothetical protein